MTVTGRLSVKKQSAQAIASAGVEDIARQTRVVELRRLVASGRYRADAYKLALKIMVRAMARSA